MTAAVLLQRLRAAGADVSADAERLRLRSQTPLPPALIELARKHKPELLALLARDDPPSAWGLTAADTGMARLRTRNEPAVHLDGYRREGFQRPPSWWRSEPHQPPNGAWCSCCHLRRWWTRDRLGWCCFICHPPGRAGRLVFRRFAHDGAAWCSAHSDLDVMWHRGDRTRRHAAFSENTASGTTEHTGPADDRCAEQLHSSPARSMQFRAVL